MAFSASSDAPWSARSAPHAGPPAAPTGPGAPPRRSLSLLNDEPLSDREEDLLSAYQAAGALTRLLTDSRAATPFTLAVDAGWGMGKSSLMRLVDARLREFPEIRTVWYNAWSSTGPDALEGLIKSVLSQVDRNVLRRWVRRLRDGGAATAFLRAVTVLAAGPLGVSGMVDELWRRLSADAGSRNAMRDALRGLVGEWTQAVSGDRSRLLVVFIDDLDRCGEATFLAVCEAVKVYLDVPGLAFVIGIDRSAVGPGGLLRDLSPTSAAFAEKIFQTSYRIPAPSGPDIRAYVRSCAARAGIDAMLDDHLVEVLAYRAARNPRRVKRLVNGLLLEASLNPIWYGVQPEAVIRTLLLQYLYPDFYRMMTVPAGPAGPGDGGLADVADVVDEFRTYRSVRRHLLHTGPWNSRTATEVADFLRRYGLAAPPFPSFSPGLRSQTLVTLEQQLPTDFPGLAGDPAFVSLVDELVALPESRLVLRRLREGIDHAPAPTHSGFPAYLYPDVGPPPYRTGTPYGPGSPYPPQYGPVPPYEQPPYEQPSYEQPSYEQQGATGAGPWGSGGTTAGPPTGAGAGGPSGPGVAGPGYGYPQQPAWTAGAGQAPDQGMPAAAGDSGAGDSGADRSGRGETGADGSGRGETGAADGYPLPDPESVGSGARDGQGADRSAQDLPEELREEDGTAAERSPAPAASDEDWDGDTGDFSIDFTPPAWYTSDDAGRPERLSGPAEAGTPGPDLPSPPPWRRRPPASPYESPYEDTSATPAGAQQPPADPWLQRPEALPPSYPSPAPSPYPPSYPSPYPSPGQLPGARAPEDGPGRQGSPAQPREAGPATPVSPALEEDAADAEQAEQAGPAPTWYQPAQKQHVPAGRQAVPVAPVAPGSALPVDLIGFEPPVTARLSEELRRLGLTVRSVEPFSLNVEEDGGVVSVCRLEAMDVYTIQRLERGGLFGAGRRPALVLYSPRITPSAEHLAARVNAVLVGDVDVLAQTAYELALNAQAPPGSGLDPSGGGPVSPYGPPTGYGGPSGPATPPSDGRRP